MRALVRSAGALALVFAGAAEAQDTVGFYEELMIQPVAAQESSAGCGGAVSRVPVRVEANPSGGIQVGFFESSAGAIGEQLKASAWLAALVSSEILDSDLRGYRISFSWTGHQLDGPSAGALMTSGLLAILRDDPFPADATMTGTINPDGTIGPVGGIVHKVQGLAEAKITRGVFNRSPLSVA